ncbi:sigma 54-interacting transcriptional regulator [Clostridium sp. WLY-B-L2]|uniref:Sigma 54-interacting transcriptional regulator n=1 Tax=Clostridium aromativorans TaxID=2836848 RepID=A0ABS8N8Y9_9CLOT|nr:MULTISPECIES: sigma 54-interacting transcriptional regulator [Clostridium]MCC9296277.1 sigma 54-interacting transcriptional regulator [Clostridium aromativorans]
MVLNIYSSGLIITDLNGVIRDFNTLAESILKNSQLKGKNIKDYLGIIDQGKLYVTECSDCKVYIIRLDGKTNGFLEYVLENSFDEIFVTDGKGIAIYCNRAFEEHYGVDRKDILGKDASFLEKQGLVDRVMVHRVIESKETISFEQHTATEKTILNTLKPILNENHEVIYVVENCRDISEATQLKNSIQSINRKVRKFKKKNEYFNTTNSVNSMEFRSEKIKELLVSIDKLSIRDVNLLLLGESGTGKTFLANRIHDLSLRKNRPFVTINCTTIPEELIESELFGYEKGSFTGASSSGKEGLVEQANSGTLFLDEIGELPFTVQAKLLQLVQEKTYIPVGAIHPKKIDIRIIAATNKDLLQLVKKGRFREDLYYRLALGVVRIPPLRERREDIDVLLNYYLNLFNNKYDTRIKLSEYSKAVLSNYYWPGNIRELEHFLEISVIGAPFPDYIISKKDLENLSGNVIELPKIDGENTKIDIIEQTDSMLYEVYDLNETMDNYKAEIIKKARKIYKSSYKVARYLNISQSTASRLILKYCK